jgi:dihydroflavonol-4-reductase
VARGIVLALEKGRVGERYILGGANRSWLELFGALARRAGSPPPRSEYPLVLGRVLERGATLLDHLNLSRPPWAPELLRMWGWYSCADSSKARDELGYVVPTLESVLERLP